MLVLAALNTQYSTPGSMSHVTVAVLSPVATLTLSGAGAEVPLLLQAVNARAARISKQEVSILFIYIICSNSGYR